MSPSGKIYQRHHHASERVLQRWSRDRNPHDGGSYKVPSQDLNAPDLYIPLMAFITYILVMGFIMGITDTFTPEVLVRFSFIIF